MRPSKSKLKSEFYKSFLALNSTYTQAIKARKTNYAEGRQEAMEELLEWVSSFTQPVVRNIPIASLNAKIKERIEKVDSCLEDPFEGELDRSLVLTDSEEQFYIN